MPRCDRPDCTGVHDKSRPRAELCEGAKERYREAKSRQAQTEGTYRHREKHGLGVPGLRRYLRDRQRELAPQRVAVLAALEDVEAEIDRTEREIADLQAAEATD